MLNNVHPNFSGIGVSAIDTSSGMLIARPFGEVAVLWRYTLSEHIRINQYDDVRII